MIARSKRPREEVRQVIPITAAGGIGVDNEFWFSSRTVVALTEYLRR
jgi:hypothetical protein